MNVSLRFLTSTSGILAVSGVLGIVFGLFVLHPLTMVIYWFEFRPDASGVQSVWHFVEYRMRLGFTRAMLPMTSVFGLVGAVHGMLFGTLTLALARRRRALHRLERELGRDVGALRVAGESENVEFKASLRWDPRMGRINRDLEIASLKTIAAFLNHRGGSLLLGVDDTGNALGLASDYATLKHKDRDGLEQCLMGLIQTSIGAAFCSLVHIVFEEMDGQDVCRVVVEPSMRPAYVRDAGQTRYYVRTGNATRALDVDAALVHIARRTRREGRE